MPRKPAIDGLFWYFECPSKNTTKNTPRPLKQRWRNPAAVSPAVSLRRKAHGAAARSVKETATSADSISGERWRFTATGPNGGEKELIDE